MQLAAGDLIRIVDSSRRTFLKHSAEVSAISAHDVTAATAALLGLRPLGSVDADISKKLNTMLSDDAFSRPQAVLAISLLGANRDELTALEAWERPGQTRFLANSSALQLGQAFSRLTGASPELAQELVLDFGKGSALDAATLDEALESLAAASGASYVRGSVPASGKLTVPLADGESAHLDLTQDADYLLATELAHLEKAVQMLAVAADKRQLLTATVQGIQLVKLTYGSESKTASAAVSLVLKTLERVLESLDTTFGGKLVMLLSVFEQVPQVSDDGTATVAARIGGAASKRRELLGAGAVPGVPGADIIAAYVLVNRSVAWGVGILLIIFTIVTVLALVCMPLTKDTLLYSRAKID
ncbi:hypothetical protein KFL_003430100 [Klebsormidium nitens]|uniref:DUF7794 domain-containing protein n=1 Tax=Klebsormidium nitens TaxID=105231 RepID=A0A0U9HTI0_KLENI|nr:hypothetical protein KFL_003430100 [Klebsormidium nitens]|eukprot:GAQ87291.1 hypothetical protein KFL_003430100 [Klebsormidium nitens]